MRDEGEEMSAELTEAPAGMMQSDPTRPSPLDPRPSEDPERDFVTLRREHLGMLLSASLAVLEALMTDHPRDVRTWQLTQAVTGAERALLGDDQARGEDNREDKTDEHAETPAAEDRDGRES